MKGLKMLLRLLLVGLISVAVVYYISGLRRDPQTVYRCVLLIIAAYSFYCIYEGFTFAHSDRKKSWDTINDPIPTIGTTTTLYHRYDEYSGGYYDNGYSAYKYPYLKPEEILSTFTTKELYDELNSRGAFGDSSYAAATVEEETKNEDVMYPSDALGFLGIGLNYKQMPSYLRPVPKDLVLEEEAACIVIHDVEWAKAQLDRLLYDCFDDLTVFEIEALDNSMLISDEEFYDVMYGVLFERGVISVELEKELDQILCGGV